MKIGLVCPYAITRYGGVREVVVSLQRELGRRGHAVRLITPRRRSDDTAEHSDVIFIGTSTDVALPMNTTTQVSSRVSIAQVDAMLEAERFDILHFHEPWVPLLSRQLLRRSRSVNVATFHAHIPRAPTTRMFMRAASPYLRSVMKRLHVLTAVSDSGAEYAARLTSKPIEIIPNGVDVRRYRTPRQPTRSPDHKTILYVGRLEGRKGVKYLLKAFALVAPSNPEVRLVIAGDGPERERLQALARELGLTGVTFLGHVSDEAKIDLMSRATIYCSPALFGESFGIVLLESMAAGVVSVVGNNCGYAEVMKGLGAMSIVDPRSVGAFAERLELMLYDTILRTRWKEWARRYIQPFDYANIVDRYEALYASALDQYG